MTAEQTKHLELIQQVVDRMGRNSFQLKGWAITLVAALFVLATSAAGTPWSAAVAFLPALVFWGLDAYYLRQERLFRALYDEVRSHPENVEPFSMDTRPFCRQVANWFGVAFSRTIWPLYGAVVVATALVVWLLWCGEF